MARVIIGIDPGSLGGFAVFRLDGAGDYQVETYKMPDTFPDIYNLLNEIVVSNGSKDVTAMLENVGHGMPGQSSSATAKFSRHCGHIEMALYALGIRTEMATPQKWQGYYSNSIGRSKGLGKTEWKNRLKGHAQRLFPDLRVTLWNADALLIGNYAMERL